MDKKEGANVLNLLSIPRLGAQDAVLEKVEIKKSKGEYDV
jgi:hypothetical protein